MDRHKTLAVIAIWSLVTVFVVFVIVIGTIPLNSKVSSPQVNQSPQQTTSTSTKQASESVATLPRQFQETSSKKISEMRVGEFGFLSDVPFCTNEKGELYISGSWSIRNKSDYMCIKLTKTASGLVADFSACKGIHRPSISSGSYCGASEDLLPIAQIKY